MLKLYVSTILSKAVGDEPPAPKAKISAKPEAPKAPKAPAVEVDYVASDTPPPGNLGKTDGGYWKVPKGTVNAQSGKVEDKKSEKTAVEEKDAKDPLKADKEPSVQVDPAYQKERQAASGEVGVKTGAASLDQLRQQQMGGQKRAIEDFHATSQAHEKATAEYKKQSEEYESKLKEHTEAKKQHTEDLKWFSEKLKDVKAGKPVKDDSKLKDMKKEMKALRMEAARHKDELSPKHQEHQDAIDKLKEQVGKHEESLSAHEKRIKAHESDKKVRKPEESAESWEKRASKHNSKGKKLKAKHDTLKKKGAALSAQQKVLQTAADNFKEDHGKQQKKYREQLRKLAEKHDAAKEQIDTKHAEATEKHKKKVTAFQSAVDEKRGAKDKLPEKPEKPKVKEPEAPPKAPSDDKEKMTHDEHRGNASKIRQTIESHLQENKDLDDESRGKLSKLHEQASYHESLQHVPTPEHSKELRELGKRAKEMNADRPHAEVKAEQDQKAVKEKEKADKQQASKEENTPRPVQDEFDRGELLNHTTAAEDALANIHSHLDSNSEMDDETRAHLESMASKLEAHSKLKMVPTKDQITELKKIQSLTKEHSGKNFNEGAEGQDAAPRQKEPTASRTASRGTGSNALSLYNRGAAFGGKMGAAAASPYGGAGSLADTLNYAGAGAASAGHHLLNNKGKAEKPQKEEQTAKSLRLYIRR